MGSKNILIVSPVNVFPVKTGQQSRIYFMIRELSRTHRVDVAVMAHGGLDPSSRSRFGEICRDVFSLTPLEGPSLARKALLKAQALSASLRFIPTSLLLWNLPAIRRQFGEVVGRTRYDILQFEYWFTCRVIDALPYRPFLALDTHNINFEKLHRTLMLRRAWFPGARVERYRDLEMRHTRMNDLILSISDDDAAFFREHFPEKAHLTVTSGQDLAAYLGYPEQERRENIILFYGGMSSRSNIQALLRLVSGVLPVVRQAVPDVELWVVGSNPARQVKALHDGKRIKILGFVEDIRPVISKCKVCVLPLDLAAGFRTRMLEVMALGVPVVGTHNAVDCLLAVHGEQVFVSDEDRELADYAVRVLKDDALRATMARKGREFVGERYSAERAYAPLSQYFTALELPGRTPSPPNPHQPSGGRG